MTSKTCFKCHKDLPLSDFYKHPRMADGHLNKCKSCAKDDVKAHRLAHVERINEYDRERAREERSLARRRGYDKRNPVKGRAQRMARLHIKRGNMTRKPCEACGKEPADAHHDDYTKPLDVRWLCRSHHQQWHADNGPGKE